VSFLRDKIGPDGCVDGEYPAADKFYGGRTALCTYALLSAGVKADDPALRRATAWLESANLRSVYAVAFRACAMAESGEPNSMATLKADVEWLVSACSEGGQYGYESLGGKAAATFDNSNAHAAMMGVAAGAARGVEVPPDYWRRMEQYWMSQQQIDGGWGYRTIPGELKVKTYGSMTAGGLESLLICTDAIRREDFIQCKEAPQYKPVEDGQAWLDRSFSAQDNPGIGENRFYYYLWCVSRVAAAGGRKYIASRDWYAQAAAEVLPRQDSRGGWGEGPDLAESSFALMFLASGRHGVAFNKLRYAGRWNPRPRDLANLTAWMSQGFEHLVTWQIADANSSVEDLGGAPVLYISGAGPIELTDEQQGRLRTYVERGGMIVSEAACGNADFTQDMQRLLRRLFPKYALQQLPADHGVYDAAFAPKVQPGLMGVSNGVRLLAIHAPREISLGLQMGPTDSYRPWFELAANILFQATDKVPVPPRGERIWPVAGRFEPRATIRVARLKHEGDPEPEPLAWERFAARIGEERRIRLEVSPLMAPADLDASKWPLAAMTGTGDPNLSQADLAALRKYLQDGGTLLADAAGGSRAFGQWAETQLLPLLPGSAVATIELEHKLLRWPVVIDRISYRRSYAIALGDRAGRPGLIGVFTREGRLAILFSPDDLTAALVGYGGYNIRGYTPDCAQKIVTNLVFQAAGIAGPTSTSTPAAPLRP
jgi:hypothetical protein